MVKLAAIADVNQSASAFSLEKLLWLNLQHVIATPAQRLAATIRPHFEQAGIDPADGPAPEDLSDGFRARAETLAHMVATWRYCYEDFAEIDAQAANKNLRPVILEPLKAARNAPDKLSGRKIINIAGTISDTAVRFELNLGKPGQLIRVAVTGGPVSPPIFM